MIDRQTIAAILDQYEKHGWKLRRVLLSKDLRESDPQIPAAFPDAQLREADIDAAWFSRSSRPGLTAWEIRHLSTIPYALVETIQDGDRDDDIEEVLMQTETRLRDAVSSRRPN